MHSPISARQQQVLDLIKAEPFNGVFVSTVENKRKVAGIIGWKSNSGVQDCLFALAAKGYVTAKRKTPYTFEVNK